MATNTVSTQHNRNNTHLCYPNIDKFEGMNSKQTTTDIPRQSNKRPRPRDEIKEGNIMTDADGPKRSSRPIANSSPKKTKTSTKCFDKDISPLPERTEFDEEILPGSQHVLPDMRHPSKSNTAPRHEGRDSMSPTGAKKGKRYPKFGISPGGRLFEHGLPCSATGTHAFMNDKGQIEVPIRNSRAMGKMPIREVAQKPYRWCPDFLHLCTHMLLSKQDAGAMGYDWSASIFMWLYYQANGWDVPAGIVSTLTDEEARHMLELLVSRGSVQVSGSSRARLSPDLIAIINRLPIPTAPPNIKNGSQQLPFVESGTQPRSFIIGGSSPPNAPLRQKKDQGSAQPSERPSERPASPLPGPRVNPKQRRRPFSSLSDSAEGQPLPILDPNWWCGIKKPKRIPIRPSNRRGDGGKEKEGEGEQGRSDIFTGFAPHVTIHETYECCCPHCGFAGESYTKFKRHIAEHFEKDGWTEYRCPMTGCDKTFAKTELTQYMKYLEEVGLIQKKNRNAKDAISLLVAQKKSEIQLIQAQKQERDYLLARLRIRASAKGAGAQREVIEISDEPDVVVIEDDEDDDGDDEDDEFAWLDDVEIDELET
ncbi:hypothetical protein FKW77_008478 [Venturia effusa]|uniref:Uncharacterized protein n=1 Tax=Venturia effusa TaxID=50376 RepID=A0A517L7U7_9PEZI|nr:hypothetical protein FKW77_008478 [Venturia effusa]